MEINIVLEMVRGIARGFLGTQLIAPNPDHIKPWFTVYIRKKVALLTSGIAKLLLWRCLGYNLELFQGYSQEVLRISIGFSSGVNLG